MIVDTDYGVTVTSARETHSETSSLSVYMPTGVHECIRSYLYMCRSIVHGYPHSA